MSASPLHDSRNVRTIQTPAGMTPVGGPYDFNAARSCRQIGASTAPIWHTSEPGSRRCVLDDLSSETAVARTTANPSRYAVWRAANPNYQSKWVAANPAKIAAYRETKRLKLIALRASPEWKNHPTRIKESNAAKRAYAAYKAKQLEINPPSPRKTAEEKRKARRQWERLWEKTRGPSHILNKRMSVAVRTSFHRKGSSKPRQTTWPSLVGYTIKELHAHIERQFVRNMGWHNMVKWHVDHIVPLASFTYETTDDPEFRAAWAMTNLRPVWSEVNLRKHARREFLV